VNERDAKFAEIGRALREHNIAVLSRIARMATHLGARWPWHYH
jgi:hypothetical protein